MMRRAVLWGALAVIVVFCACRLATFTPQPLDSSNTLRPFFNRGFVAFLRLYRHPETAYHHWRVACLMTALIPPVLALLNLVKFSSSRALFFGSIAFSLFVVRFPTFLDFQLNPDEAEFLSGAHKLFADGNYFRSVDCGTSGPLNIYPLMWPAVFGLSPDFASSRILVLLIVFSSVYLLYRSLLLLTSDSVARIAVLPLAAAYAGFQHPNLIHYSSEHIPLLLISLAFYLSVRIIRDPANYRVPIFLLGLLTVAGFFAKMQSVPILAAMSFAAIARTHVAGRAGAFWKPSLWFVLGALPLAALNAALCLSTGVWRDFVMSYLISNQRYAEYGSTFSAQMDQFRHFLWGTDEVRVFLIIALTLLAVYAVLRYSPGKRRGIVPSDPVSWLGVLSFLSTAAALFAIYKPHRAFPHYLLFLFVPVSTFMAWMLTRQMEDAKRFVFLFVFAGGSVAQQVYLWRSQDEHHFRNVVSTIRAPEGDFIRALTQPGERIFVWGWNADPYLGSARVSATQDLNLFYYLLAPPEVTSFYRARFVQEMRAHPAALFVDAVGPTSWAHWAPQRFDFEQIPEMASFVANNYIHLVDAYGQRYFLRRDLYSRARSMSLPRRCTPGALACIDRPGLDFGAFGASETWLPALAPTKMPKHASIQADFTPEGLQTDNATIFENEASPGRFRGFRFQSIGGDRYRLILGLGRSWAFSKSILFPRGKPATLSIELRGPDVYIRGNGRAVDDMHLPSRMADSDGAVRVGSWLHTFCRFSGTVDFFQILDLDSPT